jgi:hypothetical protein
MALNNHGLLLSLEGRHQEALTVTGQAVEIRQRLARGSPAAHEPDLAESLWASAVVRVGGHRDLHKALEAVSQALMIRDRLATEQPGRFDGLGARQRRWQTCWTCSAAPGKRRRFAVLSPLPGLDTGRRNADRPDTAARFLRAGRISVTSPGSKARATAGGGTNPCQEAAELSGRLAWANPAAHLNQPSRHRRTACLFPRRQDQRLTARMRSKPTDFPGANNNVRGLSSNAWKTLLLSARGAAAERARGRHTAVSRDPPWVEKYTVIRAHCARRRVAQDTRRLRRRPSRSSRRRRKRSAYSTDWLACGTVARSHRSNAGVSRLRQFQQR